MGKGRRRSSNDGELKENRRLKLENQKLRKQISSLRKQLDRVDIDRYVHLKNMLENQAQEDEQFDVTVALDDLKNKWNCHTCSRDYLRLVIVPRADGMFYFRRCPTCSHKTKLKKYTEDVEGIDSNDKIYSKNNSED